MPQSSTSRFHILQPKHVILKQKDADALLEKYNISLSQLPKIKITDPALPEGANVGDIIKIERKDEETGKIVDFFRAVIG
jgi:DNA-directed RNA polymerase subunit H